MNDSKKRTLAIIGFIAVCAVFSFAYLIINQGKETEPVLANEPQEQQEKDSSSNEGNETEGDKDVSLSESISLTEQDKEETTPAASTVTNEEVTPTKTEQMTLSQLELIGGKPYVKEGKSVKDFSYTMNGWSPTELFVISGMEYNEGIGFNVDYGSRSNMSIPALRYPLQEKYTSLTGEVGIDDAFLDSGSTYLIHFLSQEMDNSLRELHSVQVKAGNFATPFEIDVTDVKVLVIELEKADENDDEIKVALVNTQLN